MKPISMFDPNSDRVLRGGSWGDDPSLARVANRYRITPGYRDINLGVRLARSVR